MSSTKREPVLDVRRSLKRLLANSVIDEETHRYLTPQVPKAGRFYILPKIE